MKWGIKYLLPVISIGICILLGWSIYKYVNRERFEVGGPKNAVVFTNDAYAGFGSVFFFMIQAYIYAKKNGNDFRIKDDGWAYKYDKGWHDYFDSLDDYDPSVKYDEVKHSSHNNNYDIPDYTFNEYSDAIQEVLKPVRRIQDMAKRTINSMNGPYVSIYVRRGDKVEGSNTEMEAADLSKVIASTGIKSGNVFVMTDDYSVVEEIRRLLPDCTVTTLTSPNTRGSFHHNIRKNTAEEQRQHGEELFSSIEVFHNATQGWADGRSNMGRLLKLRDPAKVTLYPSDEVPPDSIIRPWYPFCELYIG
jgi:hypothetical protein